MSLPAICHFFPQPHVIMALQEHALSLFERILLDQPALLEKHLPVSIELVGLEDSVQRREAVLISLPHTSHWELFMTHQVPQTLLRYFLGKLN